MDKPAPTTLEAVEPEVAQRGPTPANASVTLTLKGGRDGKVTVGTPLGAQGRVHPFVPGQRVRVVGYRGQRTIERKTVPVRPIQGTDSGGFAINLGRLIKSGKYRIAATKIVSPEQEGASARTRPVRVTYPDLDPGQRGDSVRLFNKLLARKAYYTAKGAKYGDATGRAVLAFRKVNNMSRSTQATPGIFRDLANGKGGFRLKWPGGGKHIETDLSRQVMVLAKNGKPKHIFHISSGAPATPTIRGKFPTYRKDYGTNSLGMIHSVYFIRGYATHGYHSVPNYPASHGCLRNPPPNSNFIYKWIDIGDVFYVYR